MHCAGHRANAPHDAAEERVAVAVPAGHGEPEAGHAHEPEDAQGAPCPLSPPLVAVTLPTAAAAALWRAEEALLLQPPCCVHLPWLTHDILQALCCILLESKQCGGIRTGG